ncbi:DUF6049 family protein [Nonomuraea sp. NPDC005983]|uniref:DUF6049 family protein n=1 Tax=Nonomuraea sp. NPDC005983 TaxID=3155595 RepID=UPI00339E28A3
MIRKATLLAVLSATLLAPMVATTPGAAAAKTSARQAISLSISSITPDVPTQQAQEITISGTVRNESGTPLPNLWVRVRYSTQRFTDRANLSAYQSDQNQATLPPTPSTRTPQSSLRIQSLDTNGSATFSLKVTPAQFALPGFGVYPLAVEVVQNGYAPLAVQRTYLTYAPPTPQKLPRNKLAVALPLIDQPHQVALPVDPRAKPTGAIFVDDKLSAALAGKGRLADLARVAKSAPKTVTWFADPALFADVEALTKGHTIQTKDKQEGRPADANAAAWLADIRQSLANVPVVATPYADPDVTALAHQGLDTQTGRAMELGAQEARRLIKPDVQTSTNWPAAGVLDADALDLLAVGKPKVAKTDRVLLNSANLPTQTPVTFTPDAATTLDSVNGPVTALVADTELSKLFEPVPGVPGSAVLSKQRFIAETALIASEPGQTTPRQLVVAPSRRWDPNPQLVKTLLDTADRLPWLTLTPLSSLKATKTSTPRAPLTYTEENRKDELGAKYLGRVKEVAAKAHATASITGQQESDFDASVLRLASSGWRNTTRTGRAATKLVNEAVDKRIDGISIAGADPDQPRTLAGRDGVVPISVKNTLDDPVYVFIDVKSDNPELLHVKFDQTEPQKILSQQSATVQVEMTALTSGDATVTVQLSTVDHKPYGEPRKLTIRSTGYTGVALVIVGGALTVMLAAVVTRVLRRRSQRRLARAKSRESETV